uniref:Putative capsid protein n=1 Tax=Periparus ater CRESS-DNA-virus sp. TaxID=2815050 RepID=A0A8A4XCG9_9VIRU|nr:MAG: putative capsid protein [Periparus ater CRESS-DNA-virus sp.]
MTTLVRRSGWCVKGWNQVLRHQCISFCWRMRTRINRYRRRLRRRSKGTGRRKGLRIRRMIKRRRRNDLVKMTFRSTEYFNLQVHADGYVLPAKGTESDAENFRSGFKTSALKSTTFFNYCTMYRWCKINSVSVYWKAYLVASDMVYKNDKGENYTAGIHEVSQRIPFRMIWDLDSSVPETIDPGLFEHNLHTRNIPCNGGKAGVFKYKMPSVMRQFVSAKDVRTINWDSDNFSDCIKKLNFTSTKIRVPNWFGGTVDKLLYFLNAPHNDKFEYPMKIVLCANVYANCTFKGLNMQ